MKYRKWTILMVLMVCCMTFSSCKTERQQAVTENRITAIPAEEAYGSQWIRSDVSILQSAGQAVLAETADGRILYDLQDQTQQAISEHALCVSAQEDGLWTVLKDPEAENLNIELPSGQCWTLSPDYPGLEAMALYPGTDAAIFHMGNTLYYTNENGTKEVNREVRWSAAVYAQGTFYAIGCPNGIDPWKNYLYKIHENGCEAVGLLEAEGYAKYMCTDGENVILVTSAAVYRLEEDQLIRLTGLVERGIDPKKVVGAPCSSGEICLLCPEGYFLLRHGEPVTDAEASEKKPEKAVLDAALLWGDYEIAGLFALYNRQSDCAEIHTTIYETPDLLTAELLAGHVPDILHAQGDFEYLRQMQSKGLLSPITGIVREHTTEEDYFLNILEGSAIDGEIYYVPLGFELELFAVPSALLGDKTRIGTLEELDQILAAAGPDAYRYDTRELMLSHLLMDGLPRWVDYETSTAHFDQPDFGDILAYCKRFAEDFQAVDSSTASPVQYFNIRRASALHYRMEGSPYGEEVSFISAPFSPYEGAAISGRYFMAKTTEASPAADDFFQFILSDQAQEFLRSVGGYLPVKRSAMKVEPANEGWLHAADPADEKEEAQLVQMIEQADHYSAMMYNAITDIVMEEADWYFSDTKSLEEVQALIQNRVTLYLQEQHG